MDFPSLASSPKCSEAYSKDRQGLALLHGKNQYQISTWVSGRQLSQKKKKELEVNPKFQLRGKLLKVIYWSRTTGKG